MTPATRHVVVGRFGGPEAMRLATGFAPVPGAGQVRVRVRFSGVAHSDVLMRAGRYPGGPRPGFVPGWEVAGEVETLGAGVGAQWLGRRVVALVLRGGYASHVVAPVEDLVCVPEGTDLAQAACLPLNYVTAYQMLHRVARVAEGEQVLVHGAAGGVGGALLDLSRLAGVSALGTASGGKHRAVARFGAYPIDYTREDFAARVGEAADGVDAVFDPVGGATLARSFGVLRPGGRLVSYGFSAAGRHPRLAVVRQLARLRAWSLAPNGRQATFYRFSAAVRRRPEQAREDLATLMRLLSSGRIAPLVADTIPLEQAARAHELVEHARVTGKLLLTP